MTATVTIDSTILGGLPCTIKGWIAPREPDVGIFDEWVDDVEVCFTSGTPMSRKILDRIKEKEWRRIEEDLLQADKERYNEYG